MKRILSIVLMLSMALTLSLGSIGCIAYAETPAVSIGTVEGYAGDTVSVNISIFGNPGIASMDFFVGYDSSKLELSKITTGNVLEKEEYFTSEKLSDTPYYIGWINSRVSNNSKKNGTLATLTFKIKSGVATGKYDIKFVSKNGETIDNVFGYDANSAKKTFQITNGYITVNKKSGGSGGGGGGVPIGGGGGGFPTGGGSIVQPAGTTPAEQITETKDNAVIKTETKSGKTNTTVDISNQSKTVNSGGETQTVYSLSKETAEAISKEIKDSNSNKIVIEAVSNNTSSNTTNVEVPKTLIQSIANQSKDCNVTIKTDNGSITLNKSAIKKLSKDADGSKVQFVFSEKESSTVMARYDVSIITNSSELHDFSGGSIDITVDIPSGAENNPSAVYVDPAGYAGPVSGKLNGDGTYTFTTDHLSEYCIMSKDEATKLMSNTLDKLLPSIKIKPLSSYTSKKSTKVTTSISSGSGKVTKLKDLGYVVKYKYYRSTKKSSGYKLLSTKTTKTCTNTKGTKGKTYYYKVRVSAYDKDGKLLKSTPLKNSKYTSKKFKR